MEIATPKKINTSYVLGRNLEEGADGSDGSSSGTSSNKNDAHRPETQVTPLSIADRIQFFALGILAAFPTITLIFFGANPSFTSLCIYIGLLLSTAIFIQYEIKSGIARWFLGFILLFLTSAWKSGVLLASCEDMGIKAGLYAMTALWECSNAVLILGGKDLVERYGIASLREAIFYSLAPCQVKFDRVDDTAVAVSQHTLGDVRRDWFSPSGKSAKRSIHIILCQLGLVIFFRQLLCIPARTEFVSSFILLELECMALMAPMIVVQLDIPSHLWQLIHDLLEATPLSPSSRMHAPRAKVILPYGWVYSSSSTKEFWSRWSRPATQLIRHLFYHPLGGRNRWYVSIPIMFLLNASSHFDLSYALVGERSEVYWIMLFGTLAGAAMLEVVGDKFFPHVDSDGNTSFPSWYWWTRAFATHASLRVVLYIMVHLCFKTSLSEMFP